MPTRSSYSIGVSMPSDEGRRCQDAIEAIYDTCKSRGAARVWILDADLAAAFDKLDHSHLMSAIGYFRGRGMIRARLHRRVASFTVCRVPCPLGVPVPGIAATSFR